MSTTSIGAALVASPSITYLAKSLCSRPDLARRFESLYARYVQISNLNEDDHTESTDAIVDALGIEENILVREIMQVPAVTTQDLLLQARACALSNSELWLDSSCEEHMHEGQRACRLLVDNLCRLNGVEIFPGRKTWPIEGSEISSPSIAGGHTDRTAAECLARAEHMIEVLRTRAIHDGWKLDEVAAERFLQFFRTWVEFPTTHEVQPGYDDEWAFVIRFVGDHGQSLDWLIMGDVGGLICRAASRSSKAAKMNADPIFAAIDDHRNAILNLYELLNGDHNDDQAFEDKQATLHEQMDGKAIALTNIQPTTMNGIVALLAYVHEVNTGRLKYPGAKDSYSEEALWPGELIDEEIKNPRGRPVELPFPYWVMENIRRALVGGIDSSASDAEEPIKQLLRSPKTVPDDTPARRSSLLEAVKAYHKAVRTQATARDAFKKLTEAHPELEDSRPAIFAGIVNGEQVFIRSRADWEVLYGKRHESAWPKFERALADARPAHVRARRKAGIVAAQGVLYRASRSVETAYERVRRMKPRTAGDLRAYAKVVVHHLKHRAGGSISNVYKCEDYADYTEWKDRRHSAMFDALTALSHLAK